MTRFFALATFLWITQAWELMLGIGIAHLHWWHSLPPMGFTTAMVLSFLFFSMLTGGTLTITAYARGWFK